MIEYYTPVKTKFFKVHKERINLICNVKKAKFKSPYRMILYI